ncbi:hypothetical protein [Mesorhizobium sp.]|uniref:hypothetical protein n=1 Tax=Mesorhizobium sp. TaxID=1871066 RepID=UPI0025F82743|nr:hypothetical protein [Mesorhizobium sp.]
MFGNKPSHTETGYIYIEVAGASRTAYAMARFLSKTGPRDRAELTDAGKFYWLLRTSAMRDAFTAFMRPTSSPRSKRVFRLFGWHINPAPPRPLEGSDRRMWLLAGDRCAGEHLLPSGLCPNAGSGAARKSQ